MPAAAQVQGATVSATSGAGNPATLTVAGQGLDGGGG